MGAVEVEACPEVAFVAEEMSFNEGSSLQMFTNSGILVVMLLISTLAIYYLHDLTDFILHVVVTELIFLTFILWFCGHFTYSWNHQSFSFLVLLCK